MGRPIASPPIDPQSVAHQNVRIARRWMCATLIVGAVALALDRMEGNQSGMMSALAAICTFAVLVLLIGSAVTVIRYVAWPSRLVIRLIVIASAFSGLIRSSWDGAVLVFFTLLLLWAVARTVFELWFREEDLVSGAAARAFWPTRR